jgi:hypothetical protein
MMGFSSYRVKGNITNASDSLSMPAARLPTQPDPAFHGSCSCNAMRGNSATARAYESADALHRLLLPLRSDCGARSARTFGWERLS